MIGKSVSRGELQRVLDKEKEKDKVVGRLEDELRAIPEGGCLVYKITEVMQKLAITFVASQIPGLKTVWEDDRLYIYREERR